jgi:hypothetical protein
MVLVLVAEIGAKDAENEGASERGYLAVMTSASFVASLRVNEPTVSNCVRMVECPSPETMVGVLPHTGKSMQHIG